MISIKVNKAFILGITIVIAISAILLIPANAAINGTITATANQTATATPNIPSGLPYNGTNGTNMSDAIQAARDYFNGSITKEKAVGIIGTVIVPPMPVPSPIPLENITKLEITPQYANYRVQLGESKKMVVTVKNKENKAVILSPKVVIQPYSTYVVEKEWVTITPGSVEIPAGSSQRFTVNVSIPQNASTGYYNGQIIFTDEVSPAPYPDAVPNYIHYISLSIDVWTLPKIQIIPSYIYDQLEAGKVYDYDIMLKNTGDEAIAINPIVGSDGYYGGTSPAMTDDAITVTASQSVPANTTEIVKIHVEVPADSRGYYNGWIDMGIMDPSVREGEGRISLSFNIYTSPAEPFIKNFSLRDSGPITLEVTGSSYQSYPYPYQGATIAKEPSFEVSLVGIGGTVELNLTKKVIKGSVSLGSDPNLLPDNAYQDMSTQYIATYKANVSAGEWKLKLLPRNIQSFEYSITIGE